MLLNSLPTILIEPWVRQALLEDLGRAGDITTNAVVASSEIWTSALVSRDMGVVAGLDLVETAFHMMDPAIHIDKKKEDGSVVKAGDVIAVIKGSARAILSAERVALNYLCHMSGIATATHKLVEAIKPYKAHICCTRKTTPGLRVLEKYAVRAGGGSNHRFGLDDAILIKDNHIAVAGGIKQAVTKAKNAAGHLVKIECEVDSLEQLQELLKLPIDVVMLDNMDVATLKKAVSMIEGRFMIEASGHVTVDNVKAIAATGVDIISSGWITHSAPILDIGLDNI